MRNIVAKTFRASDVGFGKVLGHLEQEVMDALWEKGEALGKDVFSEIKRHRQIAYTTVLTVLERLAKKGLVIKKRENEGYLFSAAYTRQEFSAMVSKEVIRGVIDLSVTNTLASFVDILADKDPEELERLSSLIESKKKEFKKEG